MAASVVELILARVASVLTSSTAAGARVYRARDDSLGVEEFPALNIRRADSSIDAIGSTGDNVFAEWEIDHYVRGGEIETTADALHMEVHAVLVADSLLAGKGRGLRCLGTSIETASAEQRSAKLTARYRMQVFVRPGDLTKAIN